MATTLDNEEIKIKPTITSLECEEMLNEAFTYIAQNSLKQAEMMIVPYYIYYIEQENYINIIGIWHTSRGTEFINR